MSNDDKWDRRFIKLAEHVSGWSKDPSTKVGAVLVDDNRIVRGLGYNGFPRGVKDDDDRYNDRTKKYPMIVHAELNAILNSDAPGSTLYVYPSFGPPYVCAECAKAVLQSGVKRIVSYNVETPEEQAFAARWEASRPHALLMCDEAGVRYDGISRDKSSD